MTERESIYRNQTGAVFAAHMRAKAKSAGLRVIDLDTATAHRYFHVFDPFDDDAYFDVRVYTEDHATRVAIRFNRPGRYEPVDRLEFSITLLAWCVLMESHPSRPRRREPDE